MYNVLAQLNFSEINGEDILILQLVALAEIIASKGKII